MRRILTGGAMGLLLLMLATATSWAQQHPEASIVQLTQMDNPPGWWSMYVPTAETTWYVRLGEGCENAQTGPVTLVVDGIRGVWIVLPAEMPGQCHLDESRLDVPTPDL